MTIILPINYYKKDVAMNALLIFSVRLILGIVFGLVIIRLFRPEWGVFHGVGTGLLLVAGAYAMQLFRKKKQE